MVLGMETTPLPPPYGGGGGVTQSRADYLRPNRPVSPVEETYKENFNYLRVNYYDLCNFCIFKNIYG